MLPAAVRGFLQVQDEFNITTGNKEACFEATRTKLMMTRRMCDQWTFSADVGTPHRSTERVKLRLILGAVQ